MESQNKAEKTSESSPKELDRQEILKDVKSQLAVLRKELDEAEKPAQSTETLKVVRVKGNPNEYRGKNIEPKHIIWENGDYLKGTVVQGKWTGLGKLTMGENIYYEGGFMNGEFEGNGTYSYGQPGESAYFKLTCNWGNGLPMEGGTFSYFDPNTQEEAETSLYFIFKWPKGSFYPLNMSRLVYESEEVGPKGEPFYLKELADGSEAIFRRDKTTDGDRREKSNPAFDDTEVIVLPQDLSTDFKSSLLQEMNDYYKAHVIKFNRG